VSNTNNYTGKENSLRMWTKAKESLSDQKKQLWISPHTLGCPQWDQLAGPRGHLLVPAP